MCEKSSNANVKSAGKPYWHSARYLTWFTADTAVASGAALRAVASALLVYALCGSLSVAGAFTAAMQIYGLALSAFGGTVVDRHSRRLMIGVNLGVQSAYGLFVVATLLAGRLTFVMYALAMVIMTTVSSLFGQATDAMMRSIVDDRDFAKAKTVNQGRDSTVEIVGGPLGGALYGIAPWVPYLVAGVICLLGAGCAFRLPSREQRSEDARVGAQGAEDADASASDTAESADDANGSGNGDADNGKAAGRGAFFDDFREGWRFFFSCRTVPAMTLLFMLFNLAGVGLQYGVQLHLVGAHTDSTLIGLVNAFAAVAGLVGALLANRLVGRLATGRILMLVLAVSIIGFAPLIASSAYPLLVAALCAAGLFTPLAEASALGFIFARTPDRMQGRMYTCVGVPCSVLAALSPALDGWIIDRLGFTALAIIYETILLLCLAMVLLLPALRGIPKPDHWSEAVL